MKTANTHPCFSGCAAGRYGRVHLPVAPTCNIKCNYCNRRHDCVNESRPGVTSTVLSPQEALWYLRRALLAEPRITVAGIAGPGDPFATPARVLETLELVRKEYPELILCLSSNGLNISKYISDLADLGIRYVTITINAIDPAIGAKIYHHVDVANVSYMGENGAQLLVDAQLRAVGLLKGKNITVKVNTVVVPGINDGHVQDIARHVAGLGVDLMNCIAMLPVPGTPFGHMQTMSTAAMSDIRNQAAPYLPQMRHCARCRADAVGLLAKDKSRQLAAKEYGLIS